MWLSYNTIDYKHVPIKFLRRKRNEKSRQKQICNKPFVFVLHQTSSYCTCNERWPANCCPKTQGKQWHLGPSTSSNFPRAVLYYQFKRIWNKKSISLFFLSFFFFFILLSSSSSSSSFFLFFFF